MLNLLLISFLIKAHVKYLNQSTKTALAAFLINSRNMVLESLSFLLVEPVLTFLCKREPVNLSVDFPQHSWLGVSSINEKTSQVCVVQCLLIWTYLFPFFNLYFVYRKVR